ncbi:hypothetical protein CHU98_g745 [Xylaria longipes]|nr:hypothetical protein CHU98_g745 [Xylaria longipes]
MVDLNESIRMSRTAVQATSYDDPDRDRRLRNLGYSLNKRYMLSKEPIDLNDAITFLREAVNLANRLCIKHNRTGAIKDLDQRIAIFKKVVSERPLDSPETVSRLDNPGNGYANRYLRTDAQADLYQAIAILQEAAIDATPTGHHTTERLANASLRLRGKFLRNRDMADLKEAVRLSQKYIKVAPPEHPIQAACSDTAGIISRLRYQESKELGDWDNAKDYFKRLYLYPMQLSACESEQAVGS